MASVTIHQTYQALSVKDIDEMVLGDAKNIFKKIQKLLKKNNQFL